MNRNPFVFSLPPPIAAWAAVRCLLPHYRRTGELGDAIAETAPP